MKKIYILILLVILPLNVKAISFACDSNVSSGSDFKCTIYASVTTTELYGELDLPEGFTYKSEVVGNNYSLSKNENNLTYSGTGEHDGTVSVLTITAPYVSSISEYTIGLKNIKYTSRDKQYTIADIKSKTIKVNAGSTSNNITNNSSTTTTTKKPTTTQTANNLIVTLDANGSSDDIPNLSCTMSNGVCEVNLASTKTPTREGYTFTGWGLDKNCQKGETEKYSVKENITLYACWENNNGDEDTSKPYLNTITIDGVEIEGFSKFKYDYEISISEDKENIDIQAEAISQTATVEINKPDILGNGNNTVTINVTDGEEKLTYNINIIKGNTTVSTINMIKNITIKDYNITFDPSTFIYDLKVNSKIKKLDITVEVFDDIYAYEITGNEDLKNGSTITVKAYSKEDESKTLNYLINIEKSSGISSYLTYIIIGAVVIFMVIVYFIVKMQKQKGDKDTNNTNVPKKEKKVKVKKEKIKKNKAQNNIPSADAISNQTTSSVSQPTTEPLISETGTPQTAPPPTVNSASNTVQTANTEEKIETLETL